jgi:hypothetical protein
MTISRQDQEAAVAALDRAIYDGTRLQTGQVFGPDGAMCSCAVIALGLGWTPPGDRIPTGSWAQSELVGRHTVDKSVYDFLKARRFDVKSIFHANDRLAGPGGFPAARLAVLSMPVAD